MQKLLLTLKIMPLVLTAVRSVEEAIPLPGEGKRKLELILDTVQAAFDASAELSGAFTWTSLAALVVPMVARIVDLHNALGLFHKPATETAKV